MYRIFFFNFLLWKASSSNRFFLGTQQQLTHKQMLKRKAALDQQIWSSWSSKSLFAIFLGVKISCHTSSDMHGPSSEWFLPPFLIRIRKIDSLTSSPLKLGTLFLSWFLSWWRRLDFFLLVRHNRIAPLRGWVLLNSAGNYSFRRKHGKQFLMFKMIGFGGWGRPVSNTLRQIIDDSYNGSNLPKITK